MKVRAGADQELRDHRRGGDFQPLPPGASWWQAGPELLSSLSTEGGSGAGREPTRPLVLSQTKAATLDSGAAARGLGPCQAWLLAESALARWGAKPLG